MAQLRLTLFVIGLTAFGRELSEDFSPKAAIAHR
jgi:hypothetical protein